MLRPSGSACTWATSRLWWPGAWRSRRVQLCCGGYQKWTWSWGLSMPTGDRHRSSCWYCFWLLGWRPQHTSVLPRVLRGCRAGLQQCWWHWSADRRPLIHSCLQNKCAVRRISELLEQVDSGSQVVATEPLDIVEDVATPRRDSEVQHAERSPACTLTNDMYSTHSTAVC
jgi:hypothetical protein